MEKHNIGEPVRAMAAGRPQMAGAVAPHNLEDCVRHRTSFGRAVAAPATGEQAQVVFALSNIRDANSSVLYERKVITRGWLCRKDEVKRGAWLTAVNHSDLST
jgi:hypothetical protein